MTVEQAKKQAKKRGPAVAAPSIEDLEAEHRPGFHRLALATVRCAGLLHELVGRRAAHVGIFIDDFRAIHSCGSLPIEERPLLPSRSVARAAVVFRVAAEDSEAVGRAIESLSQQVVDLDVAYQKLRLVSPPLAFRVLRATSRVMRDKGGADRGLWRHVLLVWEKLDKRAAAAARWQLDDPGADQVDDLRLRFNDVTGSWETIPGLPRALGDLALAGGKVRP